MTNHLSRRVAGVSATLGLLGLFAHETAGKVQRTKTSSPGSTSARPRRALPVGHLHGAGRRHNTGRRLALPYPDCAVRPSDCDDLAVINTLDGWGLQTRISMPFSGDIDPASVTSHSIFVVSREHAAGASTRRRAHRHQPGRLGRGHAHAARRSRSAARTAPPLRRHRHQRRPRYPRQEGQEERGVRRLRADRAGMVCGPLERGAERGARARCSTRTGRHRQRLHDADDHVGDGADSRRHQGRHSRARRLVLGPAGERSVFNRAEVASVTFRQQTRVPPAFTNLGVNLAQVNAVPGAVGRIAYGRYVSPDYLVHGRGSSRRRHAGRNPGGPGQASVYFTLYLPPEPHHQLAGPLSSSAAARAGTSTSRRRFLRRDGQSGTGHDRDQSCRARLRPARSASGRELMARRWSCRMPVAASTRMPTTPSGRSKAPRLPRRAPGPSHCAILTARRDRSHAAGKGYRGGDGRRRRRRRRPRRHPPLVSGKSAGHVRRRLCRPRAGGGGGGVCRGARSHSRTCPVAAGSAIGDRHRAAGRLPSLLNAPGLTTIDGVAEGAPFQREQASAGSADGDQHRVWGHGDPAGARAGRTGCRGLGRRAVDEVPALTPLPGSYPKAILIQMATGDQQPANPGTSAIVREGQLESRTTLLPATMWRSLTTLLPRTRTCSPGSRRAPMRQSGPCRSGCRNRSRCSSSRWHHDHSSSTGRVLRGADHLAP